MGYRLPTILYEFKRTYPNVHLILQPSESQELNNELKSGKFDLALFTNPEKLGPDIVTSDLVKETLVMIAPPGHRLCDKAVITPTELEGEVLLLNQEDALNIPLHELNVVVFDIETTGFSPEKGDGILSIGATKMYGTTILEEDNFYSLVRYEKEIPEHIVQLTGITNEQVLEAKERKYAP